VRERLSLGNYDRFYQNFVPGAVSADQALVTLTAYNNVTNRTNLFSQTDVTFAGTSGQLRHAAEKNWVWPDRASRGEGTPEWRTQARPDSEALVFSIPVCP